MKGSVEIPSIHNPLDKVSKLKGSVEIPSTLKKNPLEIAGNLKGSVGIPSSLKDGNPLDQTAAFTDALKDHNMNLDKSMNIESLRGSIKEKMLASP